MKSFGEDAKLINTLINKHVPFYVKDSCYIFLVCLLSLVIVTMLDNKYVVVSIPGFFLMTILLNVIGNKEVPEERLKELINDDLMPESLKKELKDRAIKSLRESEGLSWNCIKECMDHALKSKEKIAQYEIRKEQINRIWTN